MYDLIDAGQNLGVAVEHVHCFTGSCQNPEGNHEGNEMYEKQADANECLDPDLLIKEHVEDSERLLRREHNPKADDSVMDNFLFPIQGNIPPTCVTSKRKDMEVDASTEQKIKAFCTKINDGGFVDSQKVTVVSVL